MDGRRLTESHLGEPVRQHLAVNVEQIGRELVHLDRLRQRRGDELLVVGNVVHQPVDDRLQGHRLLELLARKRGWHQDKGGELQLTWFSILAFHNSGSRSSVLTPRIHSSYYSSLLLHLELKLCS